VKEGDVLDDKEVQATLVQQKDNRGQLTESAYIYDPAIIKQGEHKVSIILVHQRLGKRKIIKKSFKQC